MTHFTHLNVFDAIVLSVVSLSMLVAFFRGFIREVLSLGAWVGAAIITLYFFPHATELMKHHVKNEHLAAGAAALGTFVAAFILIAIINSIILRYVKTGVEVGLLDNFLGLLFGALRGVFIVSLGYLILQSIVPKDNPPDWLDTSATKDYLQKGADALVSVAPGYLHDLEGMVHREKDDAADDNKDEKGYRPEHRKGLNRLLNSTGSFGEDDHRH